MLLGRQHEDGKYDLGCEEHFDEQPLSDRRPGGQLGCGGSAVRQEAADNGRGGDGAQHLACDDEQGADGPGSADEEHGEGDGRVEEAAAYPEKDPGVDGDGHAPGQGDELQLGRVGRQVITILPGLGRGVDDGGAAKRCQHVEKGADEFGQRGHEVVLDPDGHAVPELVDEVEAAIAALDPSDLCLLELWLDGR